MADIESSTAPIYDGILDACLRVVAMDGKNPSVSMQPTSYVLHGRTCWMESSAGVFPFWVGVNGPRLFFITYMAGISPEQAKEAYAFCFGGAEKVGWLINYEPIEGGISIWANVMTDRKTPLSENAEFRSNAHTLTEEGVFWVTDIALMVQSWIRTSERLGYKCHTTEPAPL